MNEETVELWRLRLENRPPLSPKQLRNFRDRILAALKKIRAAQEEAALVAKELPHPLQISTFEIDYVGGGYPCAGCWDLLGEKWITQQDDHDWRTPSHRRLLTCVERPSDPKALAVWNRFLLAFKRAPEELVRFYGDGWWARYIDSAGREVWIPNDDLRAS
jgi:hypothetical protein